MSFDVSATAYDRFMGRYSRPLAGLFAAAADLPGTGRVLDVGCGTGALTAVLADRFGEAAVAGVDPSTSFVAATARRLPEAEIRHGSAERLPFADDTFDAALAQLVVHFMADPISGVREMVRVTRPGGVIALCVWDFAGGRAPQSLFFQALRALVPEADDESGRPGAADGDLAMLLSRVGCVQITSGEVTVEVSHETFEDWWSPYTLGVAPPGRQLAALGDAERAEVRRLCRERLPAAGFTLTATAWTARGVVPGD